MSPSLALVEQLEELEEERGAAVGGLAAGSMGTVEMLAQSTAGIAPSAVMVAGPCLVAVSAGAGTVYSYVVSTVVLLLVGWCVGRMAKLRPGEGMLSNITAAFGRGVGFVGSIGLTVGYCLIAAGCVAMFSLYTRPLLGAAGSARGGGFSGLWLTLLLMAVCVAGGAFMMIRGVRVSAWSGVALEVFSIAAIVAVMVAALVKHGLSWAPLVPPGLTVGQVVSGMVLAILGYVGFESAACLGVEAKSPERTIPRAVLGSAVLAGALYLFASYAQLVGLGGAALLAADQTPLNTMADNIGAHWLGLVIDVGALASNFACVTGSLTAASRLLHSMGETRLLHPRIAVAHPKRQTPHIAILVLSFGVLVVTFGMALLGVSELNIYGYTGTIGTFGYMLAYVLCALGTPLLVRRLSAESARAFAGALVIGGVAAACLLYVFFKNVYPVPDWPASLMPWIFVGALVASAVWYAAGPRRVSAQLEPTPL